MNLLFTALLMFCGLGAAIFATTTAGSRRSIPVMCGGFIGAVAWIRPGALPDPGWTGCIVAAVAALHLFRPDVRFLAPLCGGALAGLWSVLLRVQGVPLPAAVVLAAAVPAVSAYLTVRRPEFAPESLREEAVLAMVAMGLVVAVIPELSAGWQSALALNREEKDTSTQIAAGWVFVLTAASAGLGGVYSLLRRR